MIAWVTRTVDDTAIAYHQVQFLPHLFLPSPKLPKVGIEIEINKAISGKNLHFEAKFLKKETCGFALRFYYS
jgi:hypothetical protein